MNFRTIILACSFMSIASVAQQPVAKLRTPVSTSDIVIFTNGEQLTGELEKADAAGITFKSAMAGEITVKWPT